jgi:hypothetical protein
MDGNHQGGLGNFSAYRPGHFDHHLNEQIPVCNNFDPWVPEEISSKDIFC